MQTARAELHALVDRLPIKDLLKVKRFCEALMAGDDVADDGLPHRKVTLERLRELKPEVLAIARQYRRGRPGVRLGGPGRGGRVQRRGFFGTVREGRVVI